MSCGITVNFDSKKPENKTPEKGQTDKSVELKKQPNQQSGQVANTQQNSTENTQTNQSVTQQEKSTTKANTENTNQVKKPHKLSREAALAKLKATKLPQLLPPIKYVEKLPKPSDYYTKMVKINGEWKNWYIQLNDQYIPNPELQNTAVKINGQWYPPFTFSNGEDVPNPVVLYALGN